jgi:hypothetical protein
MTTKARVHLKQLSEPLPIQSIPLPYYSFGIQRVMVEQNQYAMVASPAKAICDKVITTSGLLLRSKKSAHEFLVENMRIDEDKLKEIDTAEMSAWMPHALKSESLQMILKAIQGL